MLDIFSTLDSARPLHDFQWDMIIDHWSRLNFELRIFHDLETHCCLSQSRGIQDHSTLSRLKSNIIFWLYNFFLQFSHSIFFLQFPSPHKIHFRLVAWPGFDCVTSHFPNINANPALCQLCSSCRLGVPPTTNYSPNWPAKPGGGGEAAPQRSCCSPKTDFRCRKRKEWKALRLFARQS